MDPRHGKRAKRPLPSDESTEKAQDDQDDHQHIFPVYSSRSQQDLSVMVSALSTVIGNKKDHSDSSTALTDDSQQQIQDQTVEHHQGIMYFNSENR